jgi:hypothetical protein
MQDCKPCVTPPARSSTDKTRFARDSLGSEIELALSLRSPARRPAYREDGEGLYVYSTVSAALSRPQTRGWMRISRSRPLLETREKYTTT